MSVGKADAAHHPSNDGERPVNHVGAVPAVLVVSSDAGLREQVAGWVEDAGCDVIICPAPDGCLGLGGKRCALAAKADLSVLDLHPEGKSLVDESGRAALVQVYRAGGRPVLVLADQRMSQPQPETAGAAFLERSADRGALLSSVNELLSESNPLFAPQVRRQART